MNLVNGTKIREILSETRMGKPSKCFLRMQKSPLFQVRYIEDPEPANMLIKDRKEAYVSTEINRKISNLPHLCSNNTILVRIIQEWYDNLWEKSSKKSHIIEQ